MQMNDILKQMYNLEERERAREARMKQMSLNEYYDVTIECKGLVLLTVKMRDCPVYADNIEIDGTRYFVDKVIFVVDSKELSVTKIKLDVVPLEKKT